MIRTICILMLVFIAASAIYYRSWDCLSFIYGALLGSGVSIYKVIILEKTVDKALGMEEKSAGNYVRLQHLLRLFISAVVLVLAAIVPWISLWGAAAGIFSFQISLYFINFSVKT